MAKKDTSITFKVTAKMYNELVYVALMNSTSVSNIVRSSIKEVNDKYRVNDIHFGDLTMVPEYE